MAARPESPPKGGVISGRRWHTGGPMIRTLCIVSALLLSSAVARGQGAPGTNLTVAVTVQRIQMRGDTAFVQYVVQNSPRSAEELWSFTVDAPSRPLRVVRPQARERWTTGVAAQGLQVASWAALGANIAAGARTPPLEFSALGLPAMVTYWAGGYFPVPDYEPVDEDAEDTLPALTPQQSLSANAVAGQTVGVEPFPTDLSPGYLLARLRTLTDSACRLGWIQGRGTCRELAEHLDQAGRELQRGQREEARNHLREFVTDVRERAGRRPGEEERGDDQREERDDRGAAVNSSAYWLLTVNAEYVLTRLCEPGGACREDR